MNHRNANLPKIEIRAIAEDEATGDFCAIIKYRNIDGNKRYIVQPKSALRNVGTIIKALDDAGAALPVNQRKARKLVNALLLSAEEAPRWKYAPNTGWYGGHRIFIHPDRVIGRLRGEIKIKPPRIDQKTYSSGIKIRGSHKGWIRGVAVPAQYSTRIVLGICATFAAPLLDFADLNSFGILVFGPGKAGKSTLLVAAGSVIGFATEQDLVNFRATDAAFGELPAAFNNMMIPINELGLLKGNAAGRSQRLGDLTYGFAEGRGTIYSNLAGIDKSKSGLKWLSIALATGEEATDQISQAAGQTRLAGASIRWIDLPATRKRAQDIFDLYEGKIPGSDRRKWVAQQCKKLRRTCRKHHGVAFVHFIEHVINDQQTLGSDLSKLIHEFVEDQADEQDDMAVRHLAMCFGIIAAAGILAVRFTTIPYSENFVLKCVKRCYRDARRALRTEHDLLRQGLRILQKNLNGENMVDTTRVPQPSRHALKACDGFLNKALITIRASRFKDWFKDPRQPAIVLQWLHSKKALPGKPALPSKPGTAIIWAESQPKWPDRKRPRSIEIDLCHGLIKKLKAEIG